MKKSMKPSPKYSFKTVNYVNTGETCMYICENECDIDYIYVLPRGELCGGGKE